MNMHSPKIMCGGVESDGGHANEATLMNTCNDFFLSIFPFVIYVKK